MTDRQLEYIVTISAEGTITKAAQKLFIGQSALSQVLSHMEEELGVRIFDRTSSGLVPTQDGELFLDAARKILEIKRTLLARYKERDQQSTGVLRIGMSQTRSWLFAPLIFPKYIQAFPNVKIFYTEGNEEELSRMLINGKLNMMFTINAYKEPSFAYTKVRTERMLLVISRSKTEGLDLDALRRFDLSGVGSMPFVLMHQGNGLRNTTDRIFQDSNIMPPTAFESNSMDVCFQMAAFGTGATIIPDSLYAGHKYSSLVEVIPLPERFGRDIAIACRKDMYLSHFMKEFVRIASLCLNAE